MICNGRLPRWTALLVVGAMCVAARADDDRSAPPPSPKLRSIFNGKNLQGWDGDPRLWSVRDGAIRGETTGEKRANGNTFLIWKGGTTGDFELRLSFRCSARNNSGIQYRSRRVRNGKARNAWAVRGYQHEIRNENKLPSVAGFIYEEGGRRGRMCLVGEQAVWTAEGKKQVTGKLIDAEEYQKLFRIDDWNDVVIIAQGPRIRHYLNGRLILDCTDEHPTLARRSGILALQLHAGKPMWAEFKNIRFRELRNELDGSVRCYLIGNSLTWDTVPSRLDGHVLWHVDCGKSLPYIFEHPDKPCVKRSALWPAALKTHQYDVLVVQPHYGSTLEEDVATIAKWAELQPRAAIVIHTGWAVASRRKEEYAAESASGPMRHSPAYFQELIRRLEKRFPGRTIRQTHAIDLLDRIAVDIESGAAPWKSLRDLHRDKIHMTLGAGRYLMHQAMRRALRQPPCSSGWEELDSDRKAYLDAVLQTVAGEADGG